MFQSYTAVTVRGLPNILGAKFLLLSSFNFDEWDQLVHTYADTETIAFFKDGFPTSYQGTICTPSGTSTHLQHVTWIDKYVDKMVSYGAMLGPFSQCSFRPWCQTDPFLTRPQKDSPDRRVIMDLSWPPPHN